MRVWFNQWFSTAYHLIHLIKEGDPGKFVIVGSGISHDSVYKTACDEWFLEPKEIQGEEYVSFCLDFCKAHEIDIFVPRRGLVHIVAHAEAFKAAGIQVFADDQAEIGAMLDDKMSTYTYFSKICPQYIPEIYKAHNLKEFLAAYEALREKGKRVCYKLVVDEGATTFRIIDNDMESIRGLTEKPGFKVSLDTAKKILANYDFSVPMLVMPYLSGVEISVDCLHTNTGNIMIPRYKTNGRYAEVMFDEKIMAVCNEMINHMQIKMPLNIQFRMDEEEQPYLLEINPRMSGGLQLSCKATGINIPSIAMNQLLGIEKQWVMPDIAVQKVAHIETPVYLR